MTNKLQYCLNFLWLLAEAELFLSEADSSPATAVGVMCLRTPQNLLFVCCFLSRNSACHSDRPSPEAASPLLGLYVPPLGFSLGLHVASKEISANIWPVTILFPQTLPFRLSVTHCRFCDDCFIIFVHHLLQSIRCLARIFFLHFKWH